MSYCPHKQWRHTVADLLYPLFKFPGKDEPVREGSEPFEFRKRKTAALRPVHGAAHSQIAVHAPDRVSGFPGIKPDRVESIPRDVLLRSSDPDAFPVTIRFVFSPGLQQFLHLVWRCATTGEGVAAYDRQSHRAWMQFHKSSRTPIKIILCRDCGTPKYMAFISLAET